eukprot:TRINITY_DN17008_c0_g1_i1.p1 TRINITY_DN17008_c0_g1~~TRINITY_DN17008_c0_g1_i1.p1  ORF type:complete len:170 (-),score=0.15 TRINITY_DN17008_c0_g1_i1:57-566(-)
MCIRDRLPCSQDRIGYELYELTSSGLTHTVADQLPNVQSFLDVLVPDTYNLYVSPYRYVHKNFGSVEIDFNKKDPIIRLQVRAIDGSLAVEKVFRLSQITRQVIQNEPYEISKCKALREPPLTRWKNNMVKKLILDRNLVNILTFTLPIALVGIVLYYMASNLLSLIHI